MAESNWGLISGNGWGHMDADPVDESCANKPAPKESFVSIFKHFTHIGYSDYRNYVYQEDPYHLLILPRNFRFKCNGCGEIIIIPQTMAILKIEQVLKDHTCPGDLIKKDSGFTREEVDECVRYLRNREFNNRMATTGRLIANTDDVGNGFYKISLGIPWEDPEKKVAMTAEPRPHWMKTGLPTLCFKCMTTHDSREGAQNCTCGEEETNEV